MKSGKEFPSLDLSQLSWTPKKEAAHTKMIFGQQYQQDKHQHDLLHSDPSRQSKEYLEALAFSLDLSREELAKEMEGDFETFGSILKLATSYQISFEAAKSLRQYRIATQETRLDDFSRWLNRPSWDKYSEEPGKPKNYRKFHKARKPKTMGQVRKRFATFMAKDAVNNEDLDNFDLP